MLIFAIIASVIRTIMMVMIVMIESLIKEIIQEVIEELANNEDYFDELGIDPLYKRYQWYDESELEDLFSDPDNPPTEEDIEQFAMDHANAGIAALQKTWHSEPLGSISGSCRVCTGLDGTVVGISDEFRSGKFIGQGPPVHPNCRCRVSVDFG